MQNFFEFKVKVFTFVHTLKNNNMKKSLFRHYFGTYYHALQTNDFHYYVNYKECDENASVIMLNNQGEVISDNYFAYSSLIDDIESKNYVRISRTIKKIINHINN